MTTETIAIANTSRIVELSTGEKANFGARNNLLSGFDGETGLLTFKVFTGEVIEFDISKIEALAYATASTLAKVAIAYAYLNKVKANLAPVKVTEVIEGAVVNTLAIAVQKEVDKLASGEFPIRGLGGDEGTELTLDQKAFALAVVKHPVFAEFVGISAEDAEGWNKLDSEDTINTVATLWEGYEMKDRNNIRKQAYHKLEKALLEIAG